MQGMIAPFQDAHTEISAPAIKREYQGFRPRPIGSCKTASRTS